MYWSRIIRQSDTYGKERHLIADAIRDGKHYVYEEPKTTDERYKPKAQKNTDPDGHAEEMTLLRGLFVEDCKRIRERVDEYIHRSANSSFCDVQQVHNQDENQDFGAKYQSANSRGRSAVDA